MGQLMCSMYLTFDQMRSSLQEIIFGPFVFLYWQESGDDLVKDFFHAINEHDLNQERHATCKIDRVLGEFLRCALKQVLDEVGFIQMHPPEQS